MKIPYASLAFAGFIFAATSVTSSAATLSSYTPDENPGDWGMNWANNSTWQNFLTPVTLAAPALVDSFSIYTLAVLANPTSVVLKYTDGSATTPNTANLVTTTSSNVTTDRVGATGYPHLARVTVGFAATLLQAGTYWFGLSGDAQELGWGTNWRGTNIAYQLDRDTPIGTPGVGSFGYALGGTVSTPGPIAGAGLPALLALSGFAAWRRRRPLGVRSA